VTKRKSTFRNTLPVPLAYSEYECKITCNKWKPFDTERDWKRKESRSVPVFNKLPNRSPFLTSRVSKRNVPMYPLATDSLSFNLSKRSVYSICPHYHNNWTPTLSRCKISETSLIYQDVFHFHSTQTLTFRKHSLFLLEDESKLFSKSPECLCAW
jgi:hypothetical protein